VSLRNVADSNDGLKVSDEFDEFVAVKPDNIYCGIL